MEYYAFSFVVGVDFLNTALLGEGCFTMFIHVSFGSLKVLKSPLLVIYLTGLP